MDAQLLDADSKTSKFKILKRRILSRFSRSVKVNIILIFGFLLSIYIYYCIVQYLFYQNHFDPIRGTDSKLCPACFGNKACPDFYRGEINIKGAYRLPFVQQWKSRPIFESFRGLYHMQREVILKRLATKAEYDKIETWICDKNRHRNADGKCYAKYALWFHIDYHPTKTMQLAHIAQTRNTAPMMHCVTDRLFDRLKMRYRERHTTNVEEPLSRPEEIMILYTLHLNQQPLMIQLFPKEDGWPFPKYFGACGRWIVEEHAGTSLDDHCQAQVWKKATILKNLLTLPLKLDKSNDVSEEWVVYIGDPDVENFMVDPVTFDVSIVDLEHMLVVDVKHMRQMKMQNYNVPFHVPSKPCGHDTLQNYFNCSQSFDKDQLCAVESSDHNIHSVCAMLLGYRGEGRAPSCLASEPQLHKVHQLLEQCTLDSGRRRQQLDSLLTELDRVIHSVKKTDL